MCLSLGTVEYCNRGGNKMRVLYTYILAGVATIVYVISDDDKTYINLSR